MNKSEIEFPCTDQPSEPSLLGAGRGGLAELVPQGSPDRYHASGGPLSLTTSASHKNSLSNNSQATLHGTPPKVQSFTTASGQMFTMAPWQGPRTKSANGGKSKQRKSKATLFSQQAEAVFVDYPRFVTMRAKPGQLELSRCDLFDVSEEFKKQCGEPKQMYAQADGTLVVEVSSHLQYQKVMTLSSLGGSSLVQAPHGTLNSSKGVITAPRLVELKYTEDKLKMRLVDQKVTDVYHVHRTQDGKKVPTNTFIITFNSAHLPEKVVCGYEIFYTRPYISRPRRCHNCHHFGHNRVKCKFQSVCVTCAQSPSHNTPCTNTPLCTNCGGQHAASSPSCYRYLFEKDILAMRDTDKISFQEARRRVRSRFVRPNVTFADALSAGNRPRVRQQQPLAKQNIPKRTNAEPVGNDSVPHSIFASSSNANSTRDITIPNNTPHARKVSAKLSSTDFRHDEGRPTKIGDNPSKSGETMDEIIKYVQDTTKQFHENKNTNTVKPLSKVTKPSVKRGLAGSPDSDRIGKRKEGWQNNPEIVADPTSTLQIGRVEVEVHRDASQNVEKLDQMEIAQSELPVHRAGLEYIPRRTSLIHDFDMPPNFKPDKPRLRPRSRSRHRGTSPEDEGQGASISTLVTNR